MDASWPQRLYNPWLVDWTVPRWQENPRGLQCKLHVLQVWWSHIQHDSGVKQFDYVNRPHLLHLRLSCTRRISYAQAEARSAVQYGLWRKTTCVLSAGLLAHALICEYDQIWNVWCRLHHESARPRQTDMASDCIQLIGMYRLQAAHTAVDCAKSRIVIL